MFMHTSCEVQSVVASVTICCVIQALAAATGRQESLIKKQYDESGDLGTVASAARATQRTMFQPSPLTVPGVLKFVLLTPSCILSPHRLTMCSCI